MSDDSKLLIPSKLHTTDFEMNASSCTYVWAIFRGQTVAIACFVLYIVPGDSLSSKLCPIDCNNKQARSHMQHNDHCHHERLSSQTSSFIHRFLSNYGKFWCVSGNTESLKKSSEVHIILTLNKSCSISDLAFPSHLRASCRALSGVSDCRLTSDLFEDNQMSQPSAPANYPVSIQVLEIKTWRESHNEGNLDIPKHIAADIHLEHDIDLPQRKSQRSVLAVDDNFFDCHVFHVIVSPHSRCSHMCSHNTEYLLSIPNWGIMQKPHHSQNPSTPDTSSAILLDSRSMPETPDYRWTLLIQEKLELSENQDERMMWLANDFLKHFSMTQIWLQRRLKLNRRCLSPGLSCLREENV